MWNLKTNRNKILNTEKGGWVKQVTGMRRFTLAVIEQERKKPVNVAYRSGAGGGHSELAQRRSKILLF